MAAVKDRLEKAKDHLAASNDPDWDRMVKGMIRAYYELLDISVDESPDLVDIEESND